MKMKLVIVTDDDTGEIHLFHSRITAISFAFQKCKEWSAILTEREADGTLIPLDELYPDENERFRFLCDLDYKDLNDIFDCYWYFQEIGIEDDDGRGNYDQGYMDGFADARDAYEW